MKINRTDRTKRLFRLMELLQAGRDCDTNALGRVLGVSRRTLFRDLQLLKDAGVPVIHHKRSRRYSIRRDYFLAPVNLTATEAYALMFVTRRMVDRRIHPNHAAAVRAATKVEAAIPAATRVTCEKQLEHFEFSFGPLPDVGQVRDLIRKLHEAILERRKVSITCESDANQGACRVVLSPYKLACLSGTWQVVGYSEAHKRVCNVSLHRVDSIRALRERYEIAPGFCLHDYLGNAWQSEIVHDTQQANQSDHVVIRFFPPGAEHVDAVSWHRTQQTRWEESGSLVFEADVEGLEEISQWILSFGEQAVVLQPAALRDTIRRRVGNIASLYKHGRDAGPDFVGSPSIANGTSASTSSAR